jgi:bacteriorhodopsin
MKRVVVWAFYAVSVLAILYLALNVYVAFRAPHLTPGEPIRIFRNPDAPSYS